MTNIPAGLSTTLSYAVLSIVFGIILFATGTLLYYLRKWAAEHSGNEQVLRRTLPPRFWPAFSTDSLT